MVIDINYNSNFQDLIKKYPDFWRKKQLKEGKFILEAGDVANKNFFVESGILRAYHYDTEKDKEIITGFFSADDTIIFYRSFAESITMYLNFEVIEDATIWEIDAYRWDKIEASEPKLHELLHKEYDIVIRRLVEYTMTRNKYDAIERYNLFMRSRSYANRIKIEYIAAYLGITPNTLYHLRGKPARKR